jgi:hypothetical protein
MRIASRVGSWTLGIAVTILSSSPAAAEEWFPRFAFHLDGQYVTSGDPRFNWMFDFGSDLDVLRGDRFRAVFVAGYEAVAGEQFRRFDVNQGNYLLEGALLFRVAGMEVGPVWHHVSRHLSDRPKRFPIDWNMISLRAQQERVRGRAELAWHADARRAVTNAFVDYTWEVDVGGRLGYRLTPRLGFTTRTNWRVVGVDDTRGRGTQFEALGEVGMRMQGQAASAELFIGAERRLDPYPTEAGTASWFLAGLRVATR